MIVTTQEIVKEAALKWFLRKPAKAKLPKDFHLWPKWRKDHYNNYNSTEYVDPDWPRSEDSWHE